MSKGWFVDDWGPDRPERSGRSLLSSYNVRIRCVGFGLFSNWSLTEAGLGSYQM